jgi:glyoxylase-like metal-dependent hydrolase (beta-lactamase superfamily II)
VLIDPGITPDEIAAVGRRVQEARAAVAAILITHVHSDHTSGIGAFPEAEVAMGPLAAAVVESGAAARSVAGLATEHGFAYRGEPRCDRVLDPWQGARVGPLTVETLAVPGHTDGGLAYRVRAADLLAVGDYLSPYEFPFVYWSTAAYRATLAMLLDVLRRDPPARVVTGHGHELDAAAAIVIGEADLAYLHAIREAVQRALAAGGSRAEAVAAGAAVEPPRPAGELGRQRAGNAELQLNELVGP